MRAGCWRTASSAINALPNGMAYSQGLAGGAVRGATTVQVNAPFSFLFFLLNPEIGL